MIWTIPHALNAAEIARARLTRFGVRVNPDSRLPRARRIVEASLRYADRETLDVGEARRLVEAHRTIIEWYLISAALGEVVANSLDSFNIAMGGADVPENDTDSRPRDLQFELLLGALIHHAGITGVALGEPDIQIQAGARTLGVAAKRLTGHSQLQKRIRKATAQISRLADYGVIALNVDQFAADIAARHDNAIAQERVNALAADAHDAALRLHNGSLVAGVYGFATLIGFQHSDDGAVMTLEAVAAAHWSGPDQDHTKMRAFLQARGAQLARNLERLVRALL